MCVLSLSLSVSLSLSLSVYLPVGVCFLPFPRKLSVNGTSSCWVKRLSFRHHTNTQTHAWTHRCTERGARLLLLLSDLLPLPSSLPPFPGLDSAWSLCISLSIYSNKRPGIRSALGVSSRSYTHTHTHICVCSCLCSRIRVKSPLRSPLFLAQKQSHASHQKKGREKRREIVRNPP